MQGRIIREIVEKGSDRDKENVLLNQAKWEAEEAINKEVLRDKGDERGSKRKAEEEIRYEREGGIELTSQGHPAAAGPNPVLSETSSKK